jgi:epoxyqueuosine reductase QueG
MSPDRQGIALNGLTGDLTARLKAEALRLGFDLVGVAPAVTPPGYHRFLDWIEGGNAAGMDYCRSGPRPEPTRGTSWRGSGRSSWSP